MSSLTKNDLAWEAVFKKHSCLQQIERSGYTFLRAVDINEFREARLMAKMDHRANRPKIFRENNLSILPTGRGEYIIGMFDGYTKYSDSYTDTILDFPPPIEIETLQYDKIKSESIAINCAYASGIFNDFLEQETVPTVSGRMSGGEFNISLNFNNSTSKTFPIRNPQIEIDLGLEGPECLALIEAKNTIFDDFIIRQLYYPFMTWKYEVSKNVRPIFFVYSNGIITLSEYSFLEYTNQQSIQLERTKKYCIVPRDITIEDLIHTSNSSYSTSEPELPFPQADSFKRVVNLLESLDKSQCLTREKITTLYDFDARQTNYYTDAGRYLGLIEKTTTGGNITYKLTPCAKRILRLPHKEKQLEIVRLIFQHKIFKAAFDLYLSQSYPPTRSQIITIMKQYSPYNISSESTYSRRASTVTAWINWILELQT